jgi:Arylsulfotransferase (ASST)
MGSRWGKARGPLVIGLLCLATAPDAQAGLSIRTPDLSPGFRPKVRDYTLGCTRPVKLSVRATGRAQARIGARRWFAGAATRRVRLKEGQAIEIVKRKTRARSTREKRARKTPYFIRCLPESFPEYDFERHRRPSTTLYLITPLLTDETGRPVSEHNFAVIFDRRGIPIWWYERSVPPIDAKVLAGGTIAWARWFGGGHADNPETAWELRRPDGKLLRTLQTVGTVTDFHDLEVTPDGNYLVLSYRPRSGVDTTEFGGAADATILDGVVQELTPHGDLVSEWSTEGHITLSETGRWWDDPISLGEPYDTTHINAVEPLASGDFLISLRNTDAVYRIDGSSGEVEWKLGGRHTPESLQVRGDPLGQYPLGAQHDVRSLGGGEISIHDNGTYLRRPRSVRYKIEGDVATLVRSVGDRKAPLSICCGSTRVIGKSILTSWGGLRLITEVDARGRRAFELVLAGEHAFSYRAFPITGEITRKELRAGMNRQVPVKK